jgi:sRNA-binding protein
MNRIAIAAISLMLVWFSSIAHAQVTPVLAEDFKTLSGKEYKDATITRVEPDGVVLKHKSGISKVYFTELPKEVQERFHYNSANAAQFNAGEQAAIAQSNVKVQQEADAKQKAIAEQRARAEQKAIAEQKAEKVEEGQQEVPRHKRRPAVSSLGRIGGGGGVEHY